MRVNEIFYSLQGEGYNAGEAAVFLRLSGCNLRCPFCDTEYEDGKELNESEIAEMIGQYGAKLVVVTGGEPALQLTDSLVERLHEIGKRVAVETNGTLELPSEVDWITLSPKDMFVGDAARPVLRRADELKVVYDGEHEPLPYPEIEVTHKFIQPCDTGDRVRNQKITERAVAYCLEHPEWRLSLQQHKLLGIR